VKILADENCEREMVEYLRAAGHDVVTILDMAPGIGDEAVFGIAQSEGRVLLTNDRDFGVIAEHADIRPPAIVLMRLERLSLHRRMELVSRTLAELAGSIHSQFVVIESHQIRTRVYEP
jgi:predicted nuclease of predicted toxin-antitoxin system